MQFGAYLVIELNVLRSATIFDLESDQMLKKKKFKNSAQETKVY